MQTLGACAQQVDDVEVPPQVYHDLELGDEGLDDGGGLLLAHLDGDRGGRLAADDAERLGLPDDAEGARPEHGACTRNNKGVSISGKKDVCPIPFARQVGLSWRAASGPVLGARHKRHWECKKGMKDEAFVEIDFCTTSWTLFCRPAKSAGRKRTQLHPGGGKFKLDVVREGPRLAACVQSGVPVGNGVHRVNVEVLPGVLGLPLEQPPARKLLSNIICPLSHE